MYKHAVRPSSWAKARDRVRRIKRTLGELPVTELDYRTVAEWQSTLGRELAPWTVRHHRPTLAQVMDEAVKMGALAGNPVRSVKPVRITTADGVALDRDESRALLAAVKDHRLGAAVALLFLQGWRISEVLGLAWETSTSTPERPPCAGRRCTSTGWGSSLGRPRPTGHAGSTG